jgi:hypothetical protein
MGPIVSVSDNLTEDEVLRLTTVLVFHLVQEAGGQVTLSADQADKAASGLNTNMIHMQIGNKVTLRIVRRPPELQETSGEAPS